MSTVHEQFIQAVKDGKNCCLTGGGGVGKTYTVNMMADELSERKSIVYLATTGLAAMHINGQTLHSFAGLGTYNNVEHLKYIKKSSKWHGVVERVSRYDIHVIDECSMLRSDVLELLNLIYKEVAQYIAKHTYYEEDLYSHLPELPFGGKQMIFVGDFCQLPPVVKKGEYVDEPWAFQSEAWRNADIEVFNLTEVKRQDEKELIYALNEIRYGQCSILTDALFANRENADLGLEFEPIKLMSTNRQVDSINMRNLDELDRPVLSFDATFSYHPKLTDEFCHEIDLTAEAAQYERQRLYHQIVKSVTCNETIQLKEGCRVILLKNDANGYFVNGSMGIFLEHCTIIDTRIMKYYDATYRMDVFDIRYEEDKDVPGVLKIHPEDLEKATEKLTKWSPQGVLKVKLDTGRFVFVTTAKYTIRSTRFFTEQGKDEDGKPIYGAPEDEVTMYQFPVRLAYAITIHKSQGMTLENVEIDCKGMFAPGQAYVALSRVKSLWGLRLLNWWSGYVKADPIAVEFYKRVEAKQNGGRDESGV